MIKKRTLILLFTTIVYFIPMAEMFSQSDNCVVGSSALLTPGAAGAACSPVAYNTNAGFTDSNQGCAAGTEDDDGWFRFTATATSHTITVDGAANMDAVLGVYSNCTGTQPTGGGCVDATAGDGIETRTITGLTVGVEYYICVHDYAAGGGDFTICITTPGPPNCATYTAPTDGQDLFCVTSTTLSWNAPTGGTAATGYNVYFGTNNPPTNIVNGTNQAGTTYNATGLTVGTTYYWQVVPTNAYGSASNCALSSFEIVPCYNLTSGTVTTCSGGFYDSGGPSTSAGNSSNIVETFCPATAGQCIQASFFSFGTEASSDLLYVYNGNSTAAPQLSGSPFSGNLTPFSIVGTPTNATGCLTFQYISNGSVQSTGWDASLICATCATSPALPPQDCGGGLTVCNDQAFAGNSSGDGILNDLSASNMGCLSAEHQSSWYYFSPSAAGNIQLAITPANGTDDYDFAIWGPMAAVTCPPSTTPIRCSYSSLDGSTGLNLTATDATEGVGGDKWVDDLAVTAGQVYILVVDNYSTSSQPFTLDWTLTNGAALSCTPLPIELVSFKGQQIGAKNYLEWTTATEINNDFFTIEKSKDGINFTSIGSVDGAGNSTQTRTYNFSDIEPNIGINYYRIKQTDFDGGTSLSGIIGIEFNNQENAISNLHPNPTNKDFSFDFYSPIDGIVKMQVLDYTGRIVLNDLVTISEGKTTLSAEIGHLANGIYSLKVIFEQTGFSAVNMLIKQ